LQKEKNNVKKILLGLVAAVAVAIAVPVAFGGSGGATVTTTCAYPISGLSGCQFNYWNGDGAREIYNPTSYNDVITPSGVENEHFEGTTTNTTGHDVVYTTSTPLTTGDSCYSFATKNTTTNWQLTINASGAYTLDCHFSK
jgi:hypothetical protein